MRPIAHGDSAGKGDVASRCTRPTQSALQASAKQYFVFFCGSVLSSTRGKTEPQIKRKAPCCRRLGECALPHHYYPTYSAAVAAVGGSSLTKRTQPGQPP